MRDEQCAAVYAWEDKWMDWNRPNTQIPVLRAYIRTAERTYRVKAVGKIRFPKKDNGHLVDGRSGKMRRLWTEFDPNDKSITIRPRHRNLAVALHEAAHAIHDKLFGDIPAPDLQPHGPLWLGIYMNLLILGRVAPKAAIVASVEAEGLKYASLWKTHPKRIRRYYADRIKSE